MTKINESTLRQMIQDIIKELLDEVTSTGNVAGYQTPYAFSKKGQSKKDWINKNSGGWKMVEDDDDADEEMKRGNSWIGKKSAKEMLGEGKDLYLLIYDTNKNIKDKKKVIKIDKKPKNKKSGFWKFYLDGGTDVILHKDTLKDKKQFIYEGRRGAYHNYRDDDSKNAIQKMGISMREVRDKLREIEKVVDMNLRLKQEMDINSNAYWKRAHRSLNRIGETMKRLQEKFLKFNDSVHYK